MSDIAKRLAEAVIELNALERLRIDTDTPEWGLDAELRIINRELKELEDEIERDPGALDKSLVRVRKKGKGRRQ